MKRFPLVLALLAFLVAPTAARANDPNYVQNVVVHCRGLDSQYFGRVRIAYTFEHVRRNEEKTAVGGLPTRFRVPSMATDVTISGEFERLKKPPMLTVTKSFAHVDDEMTLDFNGQAHK
jgi:hypothetical protein